MLVTNPAVFLPGPPPPSGAMPTIVGYAGVYAVPGDRLTEFVEDCGRVGRFLPGCFDRAVTQPEVLGLVEHDRYRKLGRKSRGRVRLAVDAVGLKFEIDTPDGGVGWRAAEAVRGGELAGASLTFVGTDWYDSYDPAGRHIREYTAVRVLDVGPVEAPRCPACVCWLRPAGLTGDAARDHDRLAYELARMAVELADD